MFNQYLKRFGIVLQKGVMTVHRKDLFCCTLYCRSQSPQVAVLLFFGPRSASLHREGGDFGGKFAFKLPRPKQSYYIHSHPETTYARLQTVTCRRACFIKKTIKFDVVGERPKLWHKLCPNQLNRPKGVQKLHRTKLQPMFSEASQTEWRKPFDFPTRICGFPLYKNGKYPLLVT